MDATTLLKFDTIITPADSATETTSLLSGIAKKHNLPTDVCMTTEIYAEMLRVTGNWPIRPSDPAGTRIVITGNTFGRMPDLPDGNILIHTGNFCNEYGGDGQSVVDWLIKLPYRIKIIIPGTYDSPYILRQLAHVELGPGVGGIILLTGATTLVDGLRIFAPYINRCGSNAPISPYTIDDIFISHIPPTGILDKVFNGQAGGCDIVLGMILSHPPRICIVGGICTGYGYCWCYHNDSDDPILCINAAMSQPFDKYAVINPPIVLTLAYM